MGQGPGFLFVRTFIAMMCCGPYVALLAQHPTSQSTSATAPALTSQNADDFDLNAFINTVHAPTVTEIIKSFEPIQTIAELLMPLPTDPDALWTRSMKGKDKRNVEELERQIHTLRAEANLAQAIPMAEEAAAIRNRLQGADHWEACDAQRLVKELQRRVAMPAADRTTLSAANAADSRMEELYRRGQYDEALPLVQSQLNIRRRVLGDEHPDVAVSLDNLALLLRDKVQFAAAERVYCKALAIKRNQLGDEHPEVAASMNSLAMLLHDKGDYAAAESFFREALAMHRKRLGNEHSDVATGLNNLAGLLRTEGDYAAAEQLFRKALAMRRKLLGDEHPSVAASSNNLATLLQQKGEYAAAESLCREALGMRRKLLGVEHLDVAASLNNFGGLLQQKGDYIAAEQLFREALALRRKLLGTRHPDVATSLNNLAALLEQKGDYTAAEALFRDALAMRRELLGEVHPGVAGSLNNLAELLSGMGDYTAAEPLFREALAMRRKLLGDEHPAVASSLNSLVALLREKGGDAAAEPLCREAIAMRRKLLGDEHPDLSVSLKNLAALLQQKGDCAAAEPLYREALAIAEKQRAQIVGGERERAKFAGQLRLSAIAGQWSLTLIRLNRPDDALDAFERGRGRAFLDLLARKDTDLVATLRSSGDQKQRDKLEQGLTSEETRRIALTTTEAILAATQRRKDLSHAEKKQLIGQQTDALNQSRRQLADASAEVLVLLREVWPDARPMDSKHICTSLTSGELLLCYSWTEEGMTLLIVPPADTGSVQGIVLAEGKKTIGEVNELASRVRKQLVGGPTTIGDVSVDAHKLLERLIPTEARPRLASAKRLVVIPDGPLNGIPLEALAAASDNSVLPDVPTVYASSATAYLNRRQRTRGDAAFAQGEDATLHGFSAVVLGDPIFDRTKPTEPEAPKEGALIAMAVPDGPAAKAGLRRGDVLLSYDGDALRSSTSTTAVDALAVARDKVDKAIEAGKRSKDDPIEVRYWRAGEIQEIKLPPGKLGVQLDKVSPKEGLQFLAMLTRGESEKVAEVNAFDQVRLFGGSLPSLPGTKREAEAIARIVRSAGGAATLLIGEDASLGKLTSAASGRTIVHLATHGLTGSAERPYDASLALTQPKTPSPDDIGFLRLDDLIRAWRGKLKDCDLVVLSACDTQRGIKKGDSVMALPWGFFYAGAPTVIATLWKVDDTATMLLMTRFYENLLGQFKESRTVPGRSYSSGTRMSKSVALQEAKQWLRNLTDKEARQRVADPSKATRGEIVSMEPPTEPTHKESPATAYPYQHPYYWAAFVLIGDPE